MSYFQVADELTQSELVLGVGSGVGLCITVLLVVGLWVRHAKCGQRSEVMMMVMMMVMLMTMVMIMVMIMTAMRIIIMLMIMKDFSATTILPLVNPQFWGVGLIFHPAAFPL